MPESGEIAAVTLSLPLCSEWRDMTRRDQCALLCDHIRAAEHFSQNSKRSAFFVFALKHISRTRRRAPQRSALPNPGTLPSAAVCMNTCLFAERHLQSIRLRVPPTGASPRIEFQLLCN